MRRFGRFLMALGAGVGTLVAVAIAAHLGLAHAPWLLNVALAKLGLVASGALMASGAGSVRLADRRERRQIASGSDPGRAPR